MYIAWLLSNALNVLVSSKQVHLSKCLKQSSLIAESWKKWIVSFHSFFRQLCYFHCH